MSNKSRSSKLREFWCSIFGHDYMFEGQRLIEKEHKKNGITYVVLPQVSVWRCQKCGKEVETEGKNQYKVPKDGKEQDAIF